MGVPSASSPTVRGRDSRRSACSSVTVVGSIDLKSDAVRGLGFFAPRLGFSSGSGSTSVT